MKVEFSDSAVAIILTITQEKCSIPFRVLKACILVMNGTNFQIGLLRDYLKMTYRTL